MTDGVRLGCHARISDATKIEQPYPLRCCALREQREYSIMKYILVILILLNMHSTVQADFWQDTKDMLAYKYNRSKEAILHGRNDFYLSGENWHAPWAYSSSERAKLNDITNGDIAYGAGFGRSIVDPNGNTHTIYALVFDASHFKPAYNLGYQFTTYWPLIRQVQGGIGYTAFFFIRNDLGYNYPTPCILPLGSLRYKNAELIGTWVPGLGSLGGNVGFLIGRFNF